MAKYAEYYEYLTGSGVIVPDTENVLTDVQEEWKEVFGQQLSVEPETPQGRIIELIARQRIFTLQSVAATSNMLNIDKAYGFILDDLGSLFQIKRKGATHTQVLMTLNGENGTIIPIGTQLSSDAGDIFINKEEYIIGTPDGEGNYQTPGSVSGTFQAEEAGAVLVSQGEITTIIDNINGLESVINNANAVIGKAQESDDSFRKRIKQSLNINSMSVLSAISSAVANIENVIQVKAYENPTDTDTVLNTIFKIPAHGVGIIVEYTETDPITQPVAYEIAGAIYKKKTLGASYMGEASGEDASAYLVEINYEDEYDNNDHRVVFAKAIEHNVAVEVSVKQNNYTGDDLEEDIKNAIAGFVMGNNPEVDRVGIGGVVSPFEIASAISSAIPDIFLSSVEIGDVGSTLSTANIVLSEAEKLVISPENITVNII